MNKSQQLIMARMGMYHSGTTDAGEPPEILTHQGGYFQQDRMINDKYRSFQRALKYSYQGASIQPINSNKKYRALINPNKLKQDYDDKILSVDFKAELKPGDVFKWLRTNTYWIIYLHELTELAYFRGDIRKCNYTINWEDENGDLHSTYAAVRGPVETKIDYVSKDGISIDKPNYSLNMLIPYNDDTYKYFKRYTRFYLQENKDVCWRIEGVDAFSMPGIIQLSAVEYYIRQFLDEPDEGLAHEALAKEIPQDAETSEITGQTFIKPLTDYSYIYAGNDGPSGDWSIKEKVPVTLKKVSDTIVTIRWTKTYSGQFTLVCGDASKTIVVESLF